MRRSDRLDEGDPTVRAGLGCSIIGFENFKCNCALRGDLFLFRPSCPRNSRRPVAAHLIHISRRAKALVCLTSGQLHAKWIPMRITYPRSETGNVNTIFCLNVPIKRQILQRCASLGFGEPFCNICAGESPRNKIDACWSRLVHLSLNPVPHLSNRGAFYVYMLPISVEGKLKEIFINFMSRRQDAGKVPCPYSPA